MQHKRKISAVLTIFFVFAVLAGISAFSGVLPADAKQTGAMSQDEDSDDDKIFDALEETLAGKGDDETTDVIVLLNAPGGQVDDELEELKGSLGDFTVNEIFSVIPGFSGSLSKQQILRLAHQERTLQLEPDAEVHAFLNTATNWFGVAKARSDFGVDGSADASPAAYSQDDIVIAVIDTGIDTEHEDLNQGKVIGWMDFVNGEPDPYDDNGHGTHVASIAAGEGEANPALAGVAPRAALVGVKVLNAAGSGTASDVISGINWVVANKAAFGIEVVNLSLGTSGCSSGTDSLSLAVDNAVSSGLVVVVAAGNSGPQSCTIGSPAAAQGAITVGAMADVGELGFRLAEFSSRGPTLDGRMKPDVVSAGVAINAARAGTETGYVVLSGTSMASPFVAGTVALMLEENPLLMPSQIKAILAGTAVDWGPPGADADFGSGRLDGYEAVRNAASPPAPGTNIALPTHTAITDSLPATGAADQRNINVIDAAFPVAITMIMPGWNSSPTAPDFDLRLFNPAGALIASSLGVSRQETIAAMVPAGGVYTLRVESFAGSGSYILDISSGSTPPPPPPPADTTPPTAPSALAAAAVSPSQINLVWTGSSDNVGVTGYRVYRDSALIATALSAAYADTGLAANTAHSYQVSAIDAAGNESAKSNIAAATTLPLPPATISVSVSAPTTGEQGETFDVLATVSNAGSSTALGVQATLMLPAGLSTQDLFTVILGDIPAGQSGEALWEISADASGAHTLTVSASDAGGAGSQSSATVIVAPPESGEEEND